MIFHIFIQNITYIKSNACLCDSNVMVIHERHNLGLLICVCKYVVTLQNININNIMKRAQSSVVEKHECLERTKHEDQPQRNGLGGV